MNFFKSLFSAKPKNAVANVEIRLRRKLRRPNPNVDQAARI